MHIWGKHFDPAALKWASALNFYVLWNILYIKTNLLLGQPQMKQENELNMNSLKQGQLSNIVY